MISTFLACNAAAQLPIEKTAPTFEEVLNGFSNADSDSVRIGVIRDLGETIGFRGGMSAESQKIANSLKQKESELDRLFQFGPFITSDSTLPPVIVEAIDVASVRTSSEQLTKFSILLNKKSSLLFLPPGGTIFSLVFFRHQRSSILARMLNLKIALKRKHGKKQSRRVGMTVLNKQIIFLKRTSIV